MSERGGHSAHKKRTATYVTHCNTHECVRVSERGGHTARARETERGREIESMAERRERECGKTRISKSFELLVEERGGAEI